MARAAQLENWTGALGSSGCSTFVGRKYLSLHEHLVMESVPSVEFEFGGQPWQSELTVAPEFGENVAVEHRVHCDDACEENAPALHVWQVKCVIAPSTSEAVPAEQSMHDVAAPSVNVPRAHCWMITSWPAALMIVIAAGTELFTRLVFSVSWSSGADAPTIIV